MAGRRLSLACMMYAISGKFPADSAGRGIFGDELSYSESKNSTGGRYP